MVPSAYARNAPGGTGGIKTHGFRQVTKDALPRILSWCRITQGKSHMSDRTPLFPPIQIAELERQRQELLDLIGSSQETISRCEDMLRRLDAVLERVELHQVAVDEVQEKRDIDSSDLTGWPIRKAS